MSPERGIGVLQMDVEGVAILEMNSIIISACGRVTPSNLADI